MLLLLAGKVFVRESLKEILVILGAATLALAANYYVFAIPIR